MKIKFSPQRRDDELLIQVNGDVLTINGVDYDFSPIPEGATLPQSAINVVTFLGDVSRVNGELEFTLLFPHKSNPPHAIAFPPETVSFSGNGILIDTLNNVYPWSIE